MKKSTIKFFPVSLGCVKNETDFEYFIGVMKDKQWEKTNNLKNADVVVINTCAFINDAKQESIEAILEYSEQLPVIVTGCLSERYKEKLISNMNEIFISSGIEPAYFAEQIDNAFRQNKRAHFYKKHDKYFECVNREPFNTFHTYIKISEGCARNCSYCIIPSIRGKYRSRKPENIIDEIKRQYERGFREFNLISEDCTLYGYDLKDVSLIDLIELLDSLPYEDIYFRLLYVYPYENIKELAYKVFKSKHFIHYLDIPFQHVSDRILKLMNRNYKTVEDTVKYIKDETDIIIRSTFIVGFPTESENDFNKLKSFIEKAYIDKIGLFMFSPEEDTIAFNYKRIKESIIIKRYNELKTIIDDVSEIKMNENIGKTKKCVFYSKDNNYTYGRLIEDLYEVDDMLICKDNTLKLYKIYNIKITDIDNFTYIGTEVA